MTMDKSYQHLRRDQPCLIDFRGGKAIIFYFVANFCLLETNRKKNNPQMLIFKNITDQVKSLWYTSHFLQFHCHLFSCLIVLFVVFHANYWKP